jgi:hypothetical protein
MVQLSSSDPDERCIRLPESHRKKRAVAGRRDGYCSFQAKQVRFASIQADKEPNVSKEEDNKAVVGRWFTSVWGEKCDLSKVD